MLIQMAKAFLVESLWIYLRNGQILKRLQIPGWSEIHLCYNCGKVYGTKMIEPDMPNNGLQAYSLCDTKK